MGLLAPDLTTFRTPAKFPRAVPDSGVARRRSDGRIGPLHLFTLNADGAEHDVPAADMGAAVVLAQQATSVRQLGKTVSLAPGEWTLCLPTRRIVLTGAAPVAMAAMPGAELDTGNFALQSFLLRRFGDTSSINRITFSLFNAIFKEAADLNPACGGELARAAIHVLKRALIESMGGHSARETLVERIHEFIGWHIRDPRLSPDTIAKALNCSPRNIHRAFASGDETVSQYVLRLRLERCLAELMLDGKNRRSVTEIAFSWGFSNGAHFSRVFKKQFGRSPKACRVSFQETMYA